MAAIRSMVVLAALFVLVGFPGAAIAGDDRFVPPKICIRNLDIQIPCEPYAGPDPTASLDRLSERVPGR